MKKTLIAAVVTVAFAGAAIHGFSRAMASKTSVPVGTTVPCPLSVNSAAVAVGSETEVDASNVNANGAATFLSVANTENSTNLEPLALTLNGDSPEYGTFNFQFDASRPAPLSTVASNQPESDFPATSNVFANVTGTVAGLPGTYTNTNPLHISSSNLRSFNPHENEVYVVVEDVLFVSDIVGAPTFTIGAGSTVTLN